MSSFLDVTVTWVDFHKHMVVRDGNGTLLFSSLTSYTHPNLTEQQIQDYKNLWIRDRRNLDWGAEKC